MIQLLLANNDSARKEAAPKRDIDHARRLVEMAGFIIMSCLLVVDSNGDASFAKSAKVFIKPDKSLVKGHAEFIRSSVVEDLAAYKIEMS